MTSSYERLPDVKEDENVIETVSTTNNEAVHQQPPQIPYITWKNAIPQIAASLIAYSVFMQTGSNLTFSAILLPQLNDTGSDIHVTESEGSWIASLLPIALPFGSLIIGPIMDNFGRKKLCIIITLLFFIEWLLLANAKSIWYIYCTRVLAGFSGGLTTASIVYVSEISHPSFRSMLLGFSSVFLCLGILLTCLFGYWLHWRTICYINSFISVISLGFQYFMPESPYWLILFKNNSTSAAISLHWLYKDNDVYENQYQILTQTESKNNRSGSTEYSKWNHFKEEINGYLQPVVYKPFTILCVIFLFQQLSGTYVIIFYALDLFSKIENYSMMSNFTLHYEMDKISHFIENYFGKSLDSYTALVLLGFIRFVMALISSVISKKFGRRSILVFSGLFMCITSFIIGFTLQPHSKVARSSNLGLYCILGYVCFSSLAYLVIPWTLIGELLPVKVKGKLGGFLIAITYSLMFGFVKAFPYILDFTNIGYIFYALSIINLCGISYIFFFLPETLGKSFSEIEQYFQ